MTDADFQRQFIAAVCAQDAAARKMLVLNQFLGADKTPPPMEPFSLLNLHTEAEVSEYLKRVGLDQPLAKAHAICQTAGAWAFGFLDLATCSAADLEKVRGVGKGVARAFLRRTRAV